MIAFYRPVAAVKEFRSHTSCSMSRASLFIPNRLKPWIDARRRFHLSHAHVQMALELGLNPKKFGKLANHRQEPWKLPVPDFIAKLYVKRFGKRFGKAMPAPVRTIEQMAAAEAEKKQAKKLRKAAARSNASEHGSTPAADKTRGEGYIITQLGLRARNQNLKLSPKPFGQKIETAEKTGFIHSPRSGAGSHPITFLWHLVVPEALGLDPCGNPSSKMIAANRANASYAENITSVPDPGGSWSKNA